VFVAPARRQAGTALHLGGTQSAFDFASLYGLIPE